MTKPYTVATQEPFPGKNNETKIESLLPLCDLSGYACFMSWAFAIGWFEGFASLPESAGTEFFLLRIPLFAGIALSSCLFLLVGGTMSHLTRSKLLEACSFAGCLGCSVALFAQPSSEAIAVFWFMAGIGQTSCFFIWSLRLKILSRRQQLGSVCGAFIIAGFTLAILPFMEQNITVGITVSLPLCSYICLLLARKHFSDSIKERGGKGLAQEGGWKNFLMQIPFEDDRRFILMKGIHTALYSTFLGFTVCAVLAPWLYPANEIVLGLANATAAFAMVISLRANEGKTCNRLPRLFIPVAGFCMLSLGVLWPGQGLLVFSAALFILCTCFEILNAHTTYAYSTYDSIRCLWELYSAKSGSAFGFLLGWSAATGTLFVLRQDHTALLVIGFLMVILLVTVDELLFKKSKLVFGAIVVDEKAQMGVLRTSTAETASPTPGKWNIACTELSKKYHLSPRQKEIFFFLAKGRNVQYIKDELVLSTPTVKSHVYSIYQKMDIHSHQELINIIEDALGSKAH